MKPQTATSADKTLRGAVEHQLDYDPAVPSKKVAVVASDGVITLTGYVDSFFDKLAAEKAAKSVYGVKAVANDIEVKLLTERIDSDIAGEAVQALERDVSVPHYLIKVMIKKGWLTLEGTVAWGYQKNAAERAVRFLAGVRGVDNNITVKPSVSTTDVHTKIEEALRRNADLDARRITVTASGSIVTLSGRVQTWKERQEAQSAAWSAPGVTSVVNHIEIFP